MRPRDASAIALAALYCAILATIVICANLAFPEIDARTIGKPQVAIQRAGLYVADGAYAAALRCQNNTARAIIVRAYHRDVVLPRYSEMEVRL